jgi:hypothetical protein
MSKLYLSFIFLLSLSAPATSQVRKDDLFKRTTLVRFNVLGLADVLDNNLSGGLEYRFHPNWSAGTDAGWIFASRYLTTNQGASGVLVRPFLRYYPDKNGIGFFEAELHYKYVVYKMEDWLGQAAVNNVPAYQVYTRFNYRKHAPGIHLKGGLQTNLDRGGNLFFECTGGVGVRWKWQGVKEGLYSENGGGITDIFNKNYVGPVALFNMRLLYKIK